MKCDCIRRAFSLAELVIVIAVLGLLVALLMPATSSAREAARRASCAVKLKNIATALHLYHDNFQKLPPSAFYNDGRNLGEKDIALKGVRPGNAGADATDVTLAPYSIFVKLLPYYESGHVFESINFRTDQAFSPPNLKWAANPIALQQCPSFRGQPVATAVDYQPPAGIGRPGLTNYKTLGATTLACLQDSASVTNNELNGGTLHPYATYSFNVIKDVSRTVVLAETKEQKYAAWWDGTTAAMPGFHPGTGNVADDREPTPPKGVPALNRMRQGEQQAFMTKEQFGGREDMQWGPSSEHPGLVNHACGGSEVSAIANNIDPVIYRAMISRRADDNEDIGAEIPK